MRKMMQLVLLFVLCGLPSVALADDGKKEGYQHQMKKIELLFSVLSKKAPKISDFFQLFGRDNEAELEMILRQDFPSLELTEWDLNKKAVKHVDSIMARPASHVSRFLNCLKVKAPDIFKPKVKYRIQTPPEFTDNFRRFTVSITNDQETKIIFEFSQNESTIENIIMPDGSSVYSLIQKGQ